MAGTSASNIVGSEGEDFVEWLCQRPFAKDFLFRGQKYMTNDGEIELSDLLMLMDDTAILFEVKTAKKDTKAAWSDDQWANWARTRLGKALSQLKRGAAALLEGLVTSVENSRQGRVAIDPSRISHLYSVVVVDHPPLDKWGRSPSFMAAGRTVSVLTTTHEELEHVVEELSTPGDFVEYLRAREQFFAKNQMFGISELDLLACYKADPEEFIRDVGECDRYVIQDGCWAEFARQDGRQRRQEFDQPSYLIDTILDELHKGRDAKLPHVEERRAQLREDANPGDYIDVVAELARLRRLDRRVAGLKLIEKSEKCVEQQRDRWFSVAPISMGGTTLVFLVSTSDRESRTKSLELATWGAKLKTKARRVLGIATEPVTGGHGFSVDAFMVDQDPAVDQTMFKDEMRDALLSQFGDGTLTSGTEFGGPEVPKD